VAPLPVGGTALDLSLTPAEESFRAEVRDFLAANVPAEWSDPGWREPKELQKRVELQRWWEGKLAAAGFAGLHWPTEYGGRGASLMEQVIFQSELAEFNAPPLMLNFVGVNLAGPTLMRHGTEAQKRAHLPRILNMEEIFCQGFSEPNAGSDLASLRTRAVADGDSFVVNGQKVWTSFAHFADWCILLCRTDTEVPKHKGLSYLLVDMRTPGIEVRPLRNLTGDSEFNEVFFTDVRVPAENLVGELNQGWTIALTTLAHERGTAFLGTQIRHRRQVLQLVEAARTTPSPAGGVAADDPAIRQRLAQAYIDTQITHYMGLRSLTTVLRTGMPGPDGSMAKLFHSEAERRFARLGVDIGGPSGLLGEDDPGVFAQGKHDERFLTTFALTIAAGTTQIQKNILAERVLGLPKG
jgi:alkylation response protein AidB-like acyl-CoA dehydrogenase